jgi:hypothetical protein
MLWLKFNNNKKKKRDIAFLIVFWEDIVKIENVGIA